MKMMLPFFATLICIMVSLQNRVQATDFLFVQTATGVTLNGTLTLTGIADKTTYFADRPVRVAGRASTEDFLTLFESGASFSEVCVYICISLASCVYSTASDVQLVCVC